MIHGAAKLEGVHPDLVRLFNDVGSQRDIWIAEGARSRESERADILAGRSGLKDPSHSKHVIVPGFRDLAAAVDVTPFPVNWNDIPAFKSLGAFVKDRAVALGISITWGGDWVTLHDFDHFEMANG
jgi:hypothetical protein